MTPARIRRAWDGSVVVNAGSRAAGGSVALGLTRAAAVRARRLIPRTSGVGLPPVLTRAVEGSALVRLGRSATAVARASSGYRWFAEEPDRQVIVVDLRDTYTVGPIVAVLVRVHEWLGPVRESSTAESTRGVYTTLASIAVRSRTGRMIVALFSPPDLPEERRGRE